MLRRNITLAGEGEEPGGVESVGSDNPVSGALVHFGGRFRRIGLGDLGRGGAPDLALRLGCLGHEIAVRSDTALGALGGRWRAFAKAGRPAFVAQRYGPSLLLSHEPLAVVKRHTGE